ncbi:hypothetical protein MKW98_008417 [Papaver atlanticum]|uniref:Uncharacterized protein n=1 Tax=Papaver atlanticum TaxID=357466 RepID=A0AAD4SII8_9MAGN|nr:hypothetical protein MKW98_008417 [Papaver atlanticum]
MHHNHEEVSRFALRRAMTSFSTSYGRQEDTPIRNNIGSTPRIIYSAKLEGFSGSQLIQSPSGQPYRMHEPAIENRRFPSTQNIKYRGEIRALEEKRRMCTIIMFSFSFYI